MLARKVTSEVNSNIPYTSTGTLKKIYNCPCKCVKDVGLLHDDNDDGGVLGSGECVGGDHRSSRHDDNDDESFIHAFLQRKCTAFKSSHLSGVMVSLPGYEPMTRARPLSCFSR